MKKCYDLFEIFEYEEDIKKSMRLGKGKNITYSKELKKKIKEVLYSDLHNYKIRKISESLIYPLNDKEAMEPFLQKYYVDIIDKCYKNTNFGISDNLFNTLQNFLRNLKYIYQVCGEELTAELVKSFYITEDAKKINCINDVLQFINFHLPIYECDKDFFKGVLKNIIETNSKEKIKVCNTINNDLSYFQDSELMVFKKKFTILNYIESTKNKENFNEIDNLLYLLFDNNLKNPILFDYLFNLYSTTNNKGLIKYWKVLLSNNDFINSENFDLHNKCIKIGKNVEISNPKDEYKYATISKIIINTVLYCNNKKLQNDILDILGKIKSKNSLELIEKLSPILFEYCSDKQVIDTIDNIEDENHKMNKKILISLDKK